MIYIYIFFFSHMNKTGWMYFWISEIWIQGCFRNYNQKYSIICPEIEAFQDLKQNRNLSCKCDVASPFRALKAEQQKLTVPSSLNNNPDFIQLWDWSTGGTSGKRLQFFREACGKNPQ